MIPSVNSGTAKRKTYVKPTLVKGPVLTDVTALKGPVVSGVPLKAPCWVARAAFGHDDIRWLIFRDWLMEDAPKWFRLLYIRYGASFGNWLEGRHEIRRVVRTMMMPAVKRRLRR